MVKEKKQSISCDQILHIIMIIGIDFFSQYLQYSRLNLMYHISMWNYCPCPWCRLDTELRHQRSTKLYCLVAQLNYYQTLTFSSKTSTNKLLNLFRWCWQSFIEIFRNSTVFALTAMWYSAHKGLKNSYRALRIFITLNYDD